MKPNRLFDVAVLLTVLSLYLMNAHADDVAWLQEIQQPPKEPSSFSVGTCNRYWRDWMEQQSRR